MWRCRTRWPICKGRRGWSKALCKSRPPGALAAVEYDRVAADLVNFLVYVGEPSQNERKRVGYLLMPLLFLFYDNRVLFVSRILARFALITMNDFVLYSGPFCPYSHRCRIVVREKNVETVKIVDVDLNDKPPEIVYFNPNNQVPVLVDRDLALYESNIINEYLDERFPHPHLMPSKRD